MLPNTNASGGSMSPLAQPGVAPRSKRERSTALLITTVFSRACGNSAAAACDTHTMRATSGRDESHVCAAFDAAGTAVYRTCQMAGTPVSTATVAPTKSAVVPLQ